MIFLKWKDKRNVVMTLRTFHKGKEEVKVERRKKEVNIPKPINAYNKSMRGVNRYDQMLTAYPTKRKRTKATYKKTFCHLINICTFKAHVLGGNMDNLQLREDLIERTYIIIQN
jgi:hypothetical protein